MSVKNAIKILISRFGLVFGCLIFIMVFALIITSLSMAFLPNMISQLNNAGLGDALMDLFVLESLNVKHIYDTITSVIEIVKNVFSESTGFKVRTSLYFGIVLVFAFRFLIGYYELPTIGVLEVKMSSNAKISFFNRLISDVRLSTKFIFAKMLYTLLFDIIITLVMFGLWHLWGINKILSLFLPLIIILSFVLLQALRYSVIALWAPSVNAKRGGIFSSFAYSARQMKKSFSRIYGSYVITWTLIFIINGLVGLVTFGAGLLLTIPMSMVFICTLNLTLYFGANNMDYYLGEDNHLTV